MKTSSLTVHLEAHVKQNYKERIELHFRSSLSLWTIQKFWHVLFVKRWKNYLWWSQASHPFIFLSVSGLILSSPALWKSIKINIAQAPSSELQSTTKQKTLLRNVLISIATFTIILKTFSIWRRNSYSFIIWHVLYLFCTHKLSYLRLSSNSHLTDVAISHQRVVVYPLHTFTGVWQIRNSHTAL